MMTDSVSITNRPPMIGSSSTVLVLRASAARAAPMASEPVSPMKICAGAAFHHRNPAHAAEHRRRDHGGVEEALIAVDVDVAEAAEADDDECGEGEDRRARGQPVEAVGQVHRVGRGEDEKIGQHAPADRAQLDARVVVPGERQRAVDMGEVDAPARRRRWRRRAAR